jgi:uncharacterized protein (DUF302 family)
MGLMSDDFRPAGLLSVASAHGPADTLRRLEQAITARGMTIFAHVDHAAGARDAQMELRPTDLLIFGSPKAGTPLMQMAQSLGVDLPLRALVYQNDRRETVIAYDDPAWLAQRHGLGEAAQPIIAKMQALLAGLAQEAAA